MTTENMQAPLNPDTCTEEEALAALTTFRTRFDWRGAMFTRADIDIVADDDDADLLEAPLTPAEFAAAADLYHSLDKDLCERGNAEIPFIWRNSDGTFDVMAGSWLFGAE